MSERVHFVRAILDKPDDRLARLAFADWLEETDDIHNRDRARFIRAVDAFTVEHCKGKVGGWVKFIPPNVQTPGRWSKKKRNAFHAIKAAWLNGYGAISGDQWPLSHFTWQTHRDLWCLYPALPEDCPAGVLRGVTVGKFDAWLPMSEAVATDWPVETATVQNFFPELMPLWNVTLTDTLYRTPMGRAPGRWYWYPQGVPTSYPDAHKCIIPVEVWRHLDPVSASKGYRDLYEARADLSKALLRRARFQAGWGEGQPGTFPGERKGVLADSQQFGVR